jgi:hypothetical protein
LDDDNTLLLYELLGVGGDRLDELPELTELEESRLKTCCN